MNARITNRKRFYKAVDVTESMGGFSILLDQRAVRSPGGAALLLPTRPLADAIAAEWDSQVDEINPASMPQFSLAVTVVDRVMPQRSAILDELAAYGGNDLLCYHDSDDAGLVARQQDFWTPWISWAQTTLQADLQIVTGIMPVIQLDAACRALAEAAATHDDWELGMLHRVVTLGGSMVLGLAFLRNRMDAAALFEAAFLDELWQAEKWGSDWEAQDRRAAIHAELEEAERFLQYLRALRAQ